MKRIFLNKTIASRLVFIMSFLFLMSQGLMGQTSSSEYQITQHTEVHGGTTNMTNSNASTTGVASMSVTVGQLVVGKVENSTFSTDFGLWSFYLKEPDTPIVEASDGEAAHPAYITVSTHQDVLSPPATGEISPSTSDFPEGHWVITREGVWKANVDVIDPAYNDNQSIYPGQLYNYGVTVSNIFGVSDEGFDAGFTLPNGKISGQVYTSGPTPGAPWNPPGNPVADVEISLSPILGKSVRLDGEDDYVSINSWYEDEITQSFTVELWMNLDLSPDNSVIFDMGNQFRLFHDASDLTASIGTDEISTALPSLENWHHVACVMDTSQLILYVDGDSISSVAVGSIPAGTNIRIGKQNGGSDYFDGWLDDIRVWETARTQDEIQRNRERALFGDEEGLLGYWKFDEGMNAIAYDGTEVRENASLSGATWSTEIPNIKLSAFTDENGNYEIRNVWYNAEDDNGTTYTVTPYKLNHAYFDPADISATLTRNSPEATGVRFIDESMFTVSGYLSYDGTNCSVVHAEILMDSASTRPETFTDAYGNFTLDLEPNTSGSLTVRFGGQFVYDTTTFANTDYIEIDTSYVGAHTFLLDGIEQSYVVNNIEEDIAGVNFTDAKKETLYVWIGGGDCMFPIGDAEIEMRVPGQGDGYCTELDPIAVETGDGYQMIAGLAPLDYELTVNHTNPNIEFESQVISFSDSSRHIEYRYNSPLEMTFFNFPWGDDCAVITQFEKDSLQAIVYENYGGYDGIPENRCPITDFSIEIRDDWNGIYTDPTPISSPNGEFWYRFQPGAPNILGGGDHPYQKRMAIIVQDELGRFATDEVWAIIQGRTITDGTDFVSQPAKTSEIPLFVLRDPPGDESFSFLSEDQTICRTISLEVEDESEDSGWATVSLGVDIEVSSGVSAFGVSFDWDTDVDITLDLNGAWGGSQTDVSLDETEVCITTSELFSTDDGGLIVGDEGDIFVGATLNLTYSRILDLSVEDCTVQIDTSHGISDMNGFHSFYVYSDYHIRHTLIPDLIELYDHAAPEDTARFGNAIRYWQNLLTLNETAKADAVPTDAVSNTGESLSNISFDALANYEYSVTTDSAVSHATAVTISTYDEYGVDAGVTWNGVGVVGGYNHASESETTNDTTDTESYSRTVGFSLGDDDPGDAFTVDLKRDLVWGMPVFDLVGGQTSNPWEEGTFKRQWCSIDINPNVQFDVEPDEAAVYQLTLGNLSETGETWTYDLGVFNETNPDGAILKVNGVNLSLGAQFEIGPGDAVNATLTVERGPTEYNYEDIMLEFAPPGEGEIADILGVDPQNADVAELSVRFVAPCSEVSLTWPETDGWIISQQNADDDGKDSLRIVFANYDTTDLDLEDITLEYSRFAEDNWFSGVVLDSIQTLGQDFYQVYWNTTSVPDGEYEIRAHAGCRLRDSYSEIRYGTIDRTSPTILGVPQPSDGILQAFDQIELVLNENIDCNQVYPNTGELFFAYTGEPIAAVVSCNENRLIITPASSVSNREIENQVLRAQVQFVKDEAGNVMADINGNTLDTLAWEFMVDRNPLRWNVSEHEQVVYVGEESIISISLNNSGGAPAHFEFGNTIALPDWVTPSPFVGDINPGGSLEILLTIDPNLNIGDYSDIVYAESQEGDEPLNLNVHAMCRPPDWDVYAPQYEYNMTLTTELSVQGDLSTDIYDRVGAFVNGECRGSSQLEKMEMLDSIGVDGNGEAIYETSIFYRSFLNVYSNDFSGETVEFRIWDNSNCNELWEIEQTIPFAANSIVGSFSNPFTLNATGAIAQEISCASGWTWFSLNLDYPDMGFDYVLQDFSPSTGDKILEVGSGNYAEYDEGVGWAGTLVSEGFDNVHMYQADVAVESGFHMVGFKIDPDNTPIYLESGWNRIGFTPQENVPVEIALSDLAPSQDNQIKNQYGFAQFDATYGWFGSLDVLKPGEGYMYNSLHADTLIYSQGAGRSMNCTTDEDADSLIQTPWDINPHDFENSMSLIALIESDTLGVNNPEDAIVAFCGDEVRGIGRPVYVPALEAYRVFMLIYGDDNDDITFKVWQAEGDITYEGRNEFVFEANNIIGSLSSPVIITRYPLGIGDKGYVPDVYSLGQNFPNPFNPRTQLGFGLPEDAHVRVVIYNLLGQEVRTLIDDDLTAGYRFLNWNSRDDMGRQVSSGIYIAVMQSGNFHQAQKMLMLK